MRDELEEAIETEENGEMFGKPDTEKKEV